MNQNDVVKLLRAVAPALDNLADQIDIGEYGKVEFAAQVMQRVTTALESFQPPAPAPAPEPAWPKPPPFDPPGEWAWNDPTYQGMGYAVLTHPDGSKLTMKPWGEGFTVAAFDSGSPQGEAVTVEDFRVDFTKPSPGSEVASRAYAYMKEWVSAHVPASAPQPIPDYARTPAVPALSPKPVFTDPAGSKMNSLARIKQLRDYYGKDSSAYYTALIEAVKAGHIWPTAVIGTGYKNAKSAAIKHLKRERVEAELREDKPQEGKVYSIMDVEGVPSIASGASWEEAEVKGGIETWEDYEEDVAADAVADDGVVGMLNYADLDNWQPIYRGGGDVKVIASKDDMFEIRRYQDPALGTWAYDLYVATGPGLINKFIDTYSSNEEAAKAALFAAFDVPKSVQIAVKGYEVPVASRASRSMSNPGHTGDGITLDEILADHPQRRSNSSAKTPALPRERRKGSKKNRPGSAAGKGEASSFLTR